MRAMIWDPLTRTYSGYELPEGAALYELDLDKKVSCASCGKKIIYGESYTSRRIHNCLGLGYSVCEECYRKEWENDR